MAAPTVVKLARPIRILCLVVVVVGQWAGIGMGQSATGEVSAATVELLDKAAALSESHAQAMAAARAEMLADIDDAIADARKKTKRKSAEAQAEAVDPLEADRARCEASTTNIPMAPGLAKVAAAYEQAAAAERAKHRKGLTRIIDRLRRADEDQAADDLERRLDEEAPRCITCKDFARSMESVAETFSPGVLSSEMPEEVVRIGDTLRALFGQAQAHAISAVDLTLQARDLHQAVLDSESYRVGSGEGSSLIETVAHAQLLVLEFNLRDLLDEAE